jgi:hypothetical protein
MPRGEDLTGQTFGLLYVVGEAPRDHTGRQRYWVRCQCGSAPRMMDRQLLRQGRALSCGCEKASRREEIKRQTYRRIFGR